MNHARRKHLDRLARARQLHRPVDPPAYRPPRPWRGLREQWDGPDFPVTVTTITERKDQAA